MKETKKKAFKPGENKKHVGQSGVLRLKSQLKVDTNLLKIDPENKTLIAVRLENKRTANLGKHYSVTIKENQGEYYTIGWSGKLDLKLKNSPYLYSRANRIKKHSNIQEAMKAAVKLVNKKAGSKNKVQKNKYKIRSEWFSNKKMLGYYQELAKLSPERVHEYKEGRFI